ncbi:MAG: DUF2200 domain-containing protein [Candidatus Nanopelagicales bacterium]
MSRIFQMPVADVYPLYQAKIERKGRKKSELNKVIFWLTGLDNDGLKLHLKNKTTFEDFFKKVKINPKAKLITGTICGVKVENIEDPLMKKIRYLDKLVDELAKGKSLEKILRS